MEISLSNCLACAGRNSRRMEISFLELALEGERMCKAGDFRSGVSVFQAAMDVGTEDLQILSAVYSQLGNAYFHLGDYSKALEFHGYDVTLTRAIGDKPGEAKASGNLGNTLKALGRFEEAIECCQRHLDISRDLNDKVGQARALYNCGNVYHAKGRSLCRSGGNPDEFSEEAITALQKAVEFYEANMSMVKETGDRAAQGRAHGNLGNTHYMLGNFGNAIVAHEQRLIIAKEFGDKAAERRAFCNLGNSFIFLGEFEVAAGHYKSVVGMITDMGYRRSLELARQLKDQAVEAQACYSLGNTYTLLQDYERAIDYHLKHLIIAQDLNDRIGVGRACWSLSNAHTALGNHEQALHFSEKHLEICKETGDHSSELIARTNISDLQVVLGLSLGGRNPEEMENQEVNNSLDGGITHVGRRHSMENLELVKLSPEKKSSVSAQEQKEDPGKKTKQRKPSLTKMSSRLSFIGFLRSRKNKDSTSLQALPISTSCQNIGMNMKNPQRKPSSDRLADEGFFDLLSRFQSNRINDQRCSIQDSRNQLSASCTPISTSHGTIKKSLSMSVSSPHIRRNIHRASAVSLPGLRTEQESQQSVLNHLMASCEASDLTDNFLDTLVKCQGSNLDDQRCAGSTSKGPTVPDEDFLSLIMRYQAKRMGAQRFSCNTTHPNRTCSETS